MTKTVDCFVVGHWALSHNKLTERHVSRHMTNLIYVQMDEDGYPQDMYECLIQTFSKGVTLSWTLEVRMVIFSLLLLFYTL